MPAETPKPIIELGIEFIVELLLFLYPYGADQMDLPHNFWLGLGSWILGTIIAIRMFWIFPLWAKRLSPFHKSLIAGLFVVGFCAVFYKPVLMAYAKWSGPKVVAANLQEQQREKNTETKQESKPAVAKPSRKPQPSNHKTGIALEDSSEGVIDAPHISGVEQGIVVKHSKVEINNAEIQGAQVGTITQGPGSIAQVGGTGNQAIINNEINEWFELDGVKHVRLGAKSEAQAGGEFSAWAKMGELRKADDWTGLEKLSLAQIKASPRWPTPYFALGIAYANLCKFDLAVANMQRFVAEATEASKRSETFLPAINQAQNALALLKSGKWSGCT